MIGSSGGRSLCDRLPVRYSNLAGLSSMSSLWLLLSEMATSEALPLSVQAHSLSGCHLPARTRLLHGLSHAPEVGPIAMMKRPASILRRICKCKKLTPTLTCKTEKARRLLKSFPSCCRSPIIRLIIKIYGFGRSLNQSILYLLSQHVVTPSHLTLCMPNTGLSI